MFCRPALEKICTTQGMLSLVQLYIINSQYLELSVGDFYIQLQSPVLLFLCRVREGSELGALLVLIFWGWECSK